MTVWRVSPDPLSLYSTTQAAARKAKVIAFRDWLVEEGLSFTHGPAPLPQDVPLK